MMNIFVADFAPQSCFCSNYFILIFVALSGLGQILVVHVQPGVVGAIAHSKVVAHSHVQVVGTVVGNNDIMSSIGQPCSPPMHDIIAFQLNAGIHPVNKSFPRVHFLQHFSLLLSVTQLNILPVLRLKLCSVCIARHHDLIAPQMHKRVRKQLEYFIENLLHQLVGLLQRHIQWTHIARVPERACYFLVLRGLTPTGSMSGRIKLRNNSNSPHHCVSNDVSNLMGGVNFLWAESSVLGNFGVGVQFQWERILVDDVPMHDIHFVVHQGIHSFVDQVNREIVASRVDHDGSVGVGRLILDCDGQISHETVGDLQFIAGD